MFANNSGTTVQGTALQVGWTSVEAGSQTGTPTYGVDDFTSSQPYMNYQAYIDSDLIPVGTFFKNKTFNQVEWKLSVPLVADEGVKMYYRTNLTEAYTELTDIATPLAAGQLSNAYKVNFQKTQWLQLRAMTSSVSYGSGATYVRLKEIRIR